MHFTQAYNLPRVACGLASHRRRRSSDIGQVTCEDCIAKAEARQDVPGRKPASGVTGAVCVCGHQQEGHGFKQKTRGKGGCRLLECACQAFVEPSAPPSRSEAEARPPATVEAKACDRYVPDTERDRTGLSCRCGHGYERHTGRGQDPVGATADGVRQVAPELRPCCPDAGDERCHGQPWGACRCYACLRAERRLLPYIVRDIGRALRTAAMPVNQREYTRRQLARLITQLRGRAQAAEREARLVYQVGAIHHAKLVRERDDALMQASAAAERAHKLEQELDEAHEELERLRQRARDRGRGRAEAVEDLERERDLRDEGDEP
ncbi:hypothetical protein [Archangium violaceum]|uniref:hypothetical protein n=1 Tax=Archangium violaceum TaxID=83451 RepID=UPI0036D8C4BB